jgi:carbamoyl-phosphate synthase large subunit
MSSFPQAKTKERRPVLIIGSGPIVIGQAAEFDFSGTQACRSLREEGYKVVLVNSNPATIQTDPETADVVYIEPLIPEALEKIIEREKPFGILSGMGGQTALNLCRELAKGGVLEKHGVKLLGSPLETIEASEDRDKFRVLMDSIGEPIPKSAACGSLGQAREAAETLGYPVVVRPAYTLGGSGGGIAGTLEELETIAGRGLRQSAIKQVLIEESVLGWKEYEYEVMRDARDTCLIVCNMENLDPMGVHTGESIVVAPAQTLSDAQHQELRDAALAVIRALKIEGGCNIQFAVHPQTGEHRIIEVNPRVSRSSALASKATGYPIARVAAKLAMGLTLDEIKNAITGKTRAAFEPSLDYVVVKIPRWPFDKFKGVERELGTQMKSTGEVMAIGRCFEEALMKAIRSLEIGKTGLEPEEWAEHELFKEIERPTDLRLFALAEALRRGYYVERLARLSGIDAWFIHKLKHLVDMERRLAARSLDEATHLEAKRLGFPDAYIAKLRGDRGTRGQGKPTPDPTLPPSYFMVDTCAAEFEAETPYYYSTHARGQGVEGPRDPGTGSRLPVVIIGSGPIRIGQGIEFDYSCVHAALALKEAGIEAVMVNNNPETVSTDFDISTRLYFEPLTLEDVLAVIRQESPIRGVILQFGGQTAVNLAVPLSRAGVPILGTSHEAMDIAEDRKRFGALLERLAIPQARSATGFSFPEVKTLAKEIGYPVLVRPSYVIGGRAMEIVYSERELEHYMKLATKASREHPILVDKFLTDALEVDMDALSDGRDVFIAGIMEHIEEAGTHSGDSFMALPPQTLSDEVLELIRDYTRKVALALPVVGLLNIQFAVKEGTVYVLEANPRASRTVPFVSKAVGLPLAKLATRIMLGAGLKEVAPASHPAPSFVSVKAPVFPFLKLPGVDPLLGPEMKSTGEAMAMDEDFGRAYWKAILAADQGFAREGTVYLTVRDEDKAAIAPIAREFASLGFRIVATRGTAEFLKGHGIPCEPVYRISERKSPNSLGLMREGKIHLIVNTPSQVTGARRDGYAMRRLAVELGIPFITALSSAKAEIMAIKAARKGEITVRPL